MKNNYVKISGIIANDVRVTKTGGGRTMTRFTVLTEDEKTFGEGTAKEYVRCVAWGKVADEIGEKSKDSHITFEGYIHNSSFTSNGEKHFSTDIVAEKICNE
jgi:single-stranded DNA-binding protein